MADARPKTMSDVVADRTKPQRYNVWLHHGKGVGWWLHEEGYDNLGDAAAGLVEAIRDADNAVGGAITPQGVNP